MSHEKDTSSKASFLDVNSLEPGMDGFRQEGGGQNEVLFQDIIEFLEFKQGPEIPIAEFDMTSHDLHSDSLEKESSENEVDNGLLILEEKKQNEVFQEIKHGYLDLGEVYEIQCANKLNNEEDPTPGPASGDNKDLNLSKENNARRGKKEIQETDLQRKSSAPSKSGSNDIRKQDFSGKCCECNKVYLQISSHSKNKHNGKLKKCTASDRVCKDYFASVEKRIEHEQQEHLIRKEFQCQHCHFSTGNKYCLKGHVQLKHSDPTPGPSSGDNREEIMDRRKKKIQEVDLQRKSSATFKNAGSKDIKTLRLRGKCCECNEEFAHIFNHSRHLHSGKLKKCTASRDCKEYFASVQKRIMHEQQKHQERKKFCCQFCHYSADQKSLLNVHVRAKHSK